jgi:hypothetical protein
VAILPVEACPDRLMAVPGETSCREVAPCGDGTWGDIPNEPANQWVDASYAGGNSNGSQLQPWIRIQDAIDAVASGAIVAVAAGRYVEDLELRDKVVRLWGRCPSMVEIEGAGAIATIVVGASASASEIHGVAVRGPGAGVLATGADLLVDKVWIHDTGDYGVVEEISSGQVGTMTLSGSLIERATSFGAEVWGGALVIENTSIRDTAPDADGYFGRAVEVEIAEGQPSSLTMSGSLLERNHDIATYIYGSYARIESSVIRDTAPRALTDTRGRGLEVIDADGVRSALELYTSVLTGNRELTLSMRLSDAVVSSTVLRGTLRSTDDADWGRGANIQNGATIAMSDSLIVGNAGLGIFLGGATGTFERIAIRDPVADVPTLWPGRGLQVQPAPTGEAAHAVLIDSLVDNAVEIGVMFADASGSVERTLIRNALAAPANGLMGDGIAAMREDPTGPQELSIIDSRVESSVRAGVSSFGAGITIEGSTFECNPIQLAIATSKATFEDRGGNDCGCGAERDDCQAVGAELEPPLPVPSQ